MCHITTTLNCDKSKINLYYDVASIYIHISYIDTDSSKVY